MLIDYMDNDFCKKRGKKEEERVSTWTLLVWVGSFKQIEWIVG
jgi:hypothetical protein